MKLWAPALLKGDCGKVAVSLPRLRGVGTPPAGWGAQVWRGPDQQFFLTDFQASFILVRGQIAW